MVDKSDWRLHNQQEYLSGKSLRLKVYSKDDHEHCEFCWQKIMDDDSPDVVRDAYATEDERYWICEECFHDFREMFPWRLLS